MHTPAPCSPNCPAPSYCDRCEGHGGPRRPVARVDVVAIPRFGVFGRARTYRGARTIATTETYPIGCEDRVRSMAADLALARGYRLA